MDPVIMMSQRQPDSPLIEWGTSVFTPDGEAESGDLHLVKLVPDGALVAVVDGAGHGVEAASAARLAIDILDQHADEAIIGLVRRCHARLKGTRGVVLSLAAFQGRDDEMTWLGVGNVEGLLLRVEEDANPDRENILLRGGVVGYRLPALQAAIVPVIPGDTLIFATDGIWNDFMGSVRVQDRPQELANRICSGYAKRSDDALVLVVRYLGWDG